MLKSKKCRIVIEFEGYADKDMENSGHNIEFSVESPLNNNGKDKKITEDMYDKVLKEGGQPLLKMAMLDYVLMRLASERIKKMFDDEFSDLVVAATSLLIASGSITKDNSNN